MNRIYKVIYRHSVGRFVVVSELAKGHVKSSSQGNELENTSYRKGTESFRLGLLSLFLLSSIYPQLAIASSIKQGDNVNISSSAASAIAIGDDTTSLKNYGIALGSKANSNGESSIALGRSANALANWATALGNGANGLGVSSVAVGSGTRANATSATALGNDAKADANSSTAVGHKATALQDYATALGYNATASQWYATALGNNATASGWRATALGDNANASGWNATALGVNATATRDAIALGFNATASAVNATALGNFANASGGSSTALGHFANASGGSSTALGLYANASAVNATALGVNATASAANATALGVNTKVSGQNSVALGVNVNATGDNSVALGLNATVSLINSVALGTYANVSVMNSVALGSGSTASQGDVTSDKSYLTNVVTREANGVISVGKDAIRRRITNVADGVLDDDVATVAQLKAQQNNVKNILGGNAIVAANGTVTMTDIGGTGKTTVHDAIKSVADSMDWLTYKKGSTFTAPTATGSDSMAFGSGAKASNTNTIALGANSNASGKNDIAIGGAITKGTGFFNAAYEGKYKDDGSMNIAIGKGASIENITDANNKSTSFAASSIALGAYASAKGYRSLAIGFLANVTNNNALAIGAEAKASGDSSAALGYFANASVADSVALGSNSTTITRDITTNNGYLTNAVTNGTNGVISVGTDTSRRRITNVADGVLNDDVATVAQLKAQQNNLKTLLGGNAAVATNGTVTMTDIGGTGKNNINDAIKEIKNIASNVTQGVQWGLAVDNG
ncbi:ESPR-type extended signal peptide-containing protein, partial [Basilea psittacipulmonis]